MKKTKFLLFIFVLLILSSSVFANENFSDAKNLVDSKISCDELSSDQLELIGDYYMEQMHPGETHELMDDMMGGEGSESLKQTHIRMAKSLYCGENNGMMGSNMMNGEGTNMMGYSNGYGMMGSGYFGWTLWSLIYVAITAFVFGLIFWWTYKIIIVNKKKK